MRGRKDFTFIIKMVILDGTVIPYIPVHHLDQQ